MVRWSYLLAYALLGINPIAQAADPLSPAVDLAEKALPYLQEEAQWWIESKGCVSCHHTSFAIWAGTLARQNGLPFPQAKLEEWREWAWARQLAPREKDKPDEPDEFTGERNIEGLSQLLLIRGSEPPVETGNRFRELISNRQKEPGFWEANGQLPRQVRPKAETGVVSTMWATLALGAANPAAGQTVGLVHEKAMAWLLKQDEALEPVTTEWFALKALLEPENAWLTQLMRRQNEDGGWSWKPGEGSDPLATGQALFAVGRREQEDAFGPEIARAVRFLALTQEPVGSWKTFSTKKRAEQTRVSNFWGTAWAVIGLLESNATSSAPGRVDD